MAKTIKFNLICDDKPVRTIEDLQNNFSIEDVLAYYNNKLLHRWLEVRGYEEELKKVKAIAVEEPIDIIKELIRIFDVECDDKKIIEGVYILQYMEERKTLYSIFEEQSYKTSVVIRTCEANYKKLVGEILENPKDAAIIKANITEMVFNYPWFLRLDHRNLFYMLKEESPLAVMCLLMNEQIRKYYLVEYESADEKQKIVQSQETSASDSVYDEIMALYKFSIFKNRWMGSGEYTDNVDSVNDNFGEELVEDRKAMFHCICKMIKTSEFRNDLGDNLKIFSGLTEGYWKDLEPKGKKYMIISMGEGDFVRASGVSGGDLSRADVINKFVIVDGIDYKSNSSTRELLYMEV